MLEYLRIRDLALIADMELDFSPGMNVLTGETGAGKSFILKAINFVLGERMGSELVRPGRERAVVEALFIQTDGSELALRRELIAETGRSRLYINESLSSQETIKELRATLILHTSQHGQQRLLQPVFQSRLIDDWMRRPDLLEERDRRVRALRELATRKASLQERFRDLADRRELLEMHLATIRKVAPEAGEEERLEALRTSLRGSEQLRRNYERAQQILRGGDPSFLDQLSLLERALETLAKDDDEMTLALEATASFRQTANELERHVRRPPLPDIEGDPEQIEARLFQLAQLKRKLHRTLPEILSLKGEIEDNLSFLDACNLDIRQVEKQEKQLGIELSHVLSQLNAARREAAESFTSSLQSELAGLGFSEHIRVIADFTPQELFPGCTEERLHLLWSPNPGQPPQALDRIASGGELSRFMLAVVSMQAAGENATLIFDEVDAGVGGITLNRVAERLESLSSHRQMLLITHWPQLASRAVRHFQVIKDVIEDETFTHCSRLEGADKDAELSRMSGIE